MNNAASGLQSNLFNCIVKRIAYVVSDDKIYNMYDI